MEAYSNQTDTNYGMQMSGGVGGQQSNLSSAHNSLANIYSNNAQGSYMSGSVDFGSSAPGGGGGATGMYNKATLNFEGNLDEMVLNWTEEELNSRRRLVQFWRSHENNTITCSFKSVNPAERVPNSIVVSCIYWSDKQEFYITSVDCIYLLESLIAVRFTVEEKNRIRRNLEGFRPLTVSKCKPESSEFFKLIMSFPNPKPRNIEKDVKVFPWKILPYALKKIVGKYTASYNTPSNGPNHQGSIDSFGNLSAYSSYAPTPYGFDGRSLSPTSLRNQQAQRRFSQPAAYAMYNSNNQRKVERPMNQGYMNSSFNNTSYSNMSFNNDSFSTNNNNFNIQPIEENPSQSDFMNQNMLESSMHPNMMMSPSKRHLTARRHSVADPYSINNFMSNRRMSVPDTQYGQFQNPMQFSNSQNYSTNLGLDGSIQEEREVKFEDFQTNLQ